MYINIVALIISCVSIFIAIFALYIAFRRYELQQKQFALQRQEFDEKFKLKFQIKDEQFLTSYELEPEKLNYLASHPDEVEFEYRATYINRSGVTVTIRRLGIEVNAIEVEKMWVICGDTILENMCLAPNEEIEIKHRFNQRNLEGFRCMIAQLTENRGVFEFSVRCFFSTDNSSESEHKRLLYRLTESGGDMSSQGYNPGHAHKKCNFLY